MALTILEGSTFCICDEIGDLAGETSGLFADDTRFLSRLKLTINGSKPLLLSSGKVEYFSAAFFLRNPVVDGLGHDVLSIKRERFVGEGMQDQIVIQNQSMKPVTFEVGLELATDFADIISVKEHDFALGDPDHAAPLPPAAVAPLFDEDQNQFLFQEQAGEGALRTQLILSEPGEPSGSGMVWDVTLDPRESWYVRVDVVTSLDGDELVPKRTVERRFGEERGRVRESLAAWELRVPQIRASWDNLGHSFTQSVADLASLRMRGAGRVGSGRLPAAGMPWFMTVFGRDSIITCMQTLLFGPELAHGALGALAELQATEDNADIDAEPGKIVHEVRAGKAATKWFERYYGTLDATPLYVDPALGALALDRRHSARARAKETRDGRARLDRPLWRSRRRRLRRVRAAHSSRAREPVVEGLRRLAALQRRPDRPRADRALRGAGLRLRREAARRGARARGVARPGARAAARARRPTS